MVGQRGKASSSPDMRLMNKRALQQQQQLTNLSKQEEEANQYVQSYVPSFAQHQTPEIKLQTSQSNSSNGLNNNKKKNLVTNDYPMAQQQRGGLGANIGTEEWNQKKEKFEKAQEYSVQVKYFNQQQQATLPPSNQRRPQQKEEEKQKSTREKALEFSKNIPKPRSKTEKNATEESNSTISKQSDKNKFNYFDEVSQSSNGNTNNNTNSMKKNNLGYNNQYESDIDILERQHMEYLNKIEQLNINS